jgi:hypothetical protein
MPQEIRRLWLGVTCMRIVVPALQHEAVISVFIPLHDHQLCVCFALLCCTQACHMHAGYVLDQEGDSWAVAFHDADDAAAFSLQVRRRMRLLRFDVLCKSICSCCWRVLCYTV